MKKNLEWTKSYITVQLRKQSEGRKYNCSLMLHILAADILCLSKSCMLAVLISATLSEMYDYETH